ncbi:MAG: hypothetical protein COT37_01445 [Parcubacteria group bacterium CG08_land_8_20_14_0_20_43_9]|nr:MAG: hypothetical protein COT37_01445 [Parcubacteria group bacterium CG08_land_8_20_14_0_20_43_9]
MENMKGEYIIKLALGGWCGITLLLGNFCFVYASVRDPATSGPNIILPSVEDAQSFWQRIKEGLKETSDAIRRFGEGNGWFKPFFENTGQKINDWWSLQTRPWINNFWYNLNNYLNQEIRIN